MLPVPLRPLGEALRVILAPPIFHLRRTPDLHSAPEMTPHSLGPLALLPAPFLPLLVPLMSKVASRTWTFTA